MGCRVLDPAFEGPIITYGSFLFDLDLICSHSKVQFAAIDNTVEMTGDDLVLNCDKMKPDPGPCTPRKWAGETSCPIHADV